MDELLARLLGHLRALWQYRWHAVVVAWTVCIIGWVTVYFLPDRYEASARVFVDTQSMLKPLLTGLAVQPNVEQQIAIMSRTLISRPNVEKVLRMADLDIKARTPEDKEKMIDRLITSIEVKSTGRDNLYTIAYKDKRPEDAKRVVQSLLTIFVESSLGDKRKDADSARRFIDEQIKAYEQKLVVAENALKDFKRQHVGMMPESGRDYFTRLGEAQSVLQAAQLELREAEHGRDALKRQVTGDEPILLPTDEPSADSGADTSEPELDARISLLKKNLDTLRLQYTERHPDIVSTKRIVEQLEQQKAELLKARKPVAKAAPGVTRQTSIYLQQLSASLAEAEANVARMQARVAELQRRYDALRAAVNAVPQVEADFVQLNRDYEVNKRNYEQLLARRESAQISGDMEANTGVMDFRVIDPPRVPSKPSAPNRPLLVSLVLFGGWAFGLVVAFALSQIKPTFREGRQLREVVDVPLLGQVSMVWTQAQQRRRRRSLVALGVSTASLVCAYAAVLAVIVLKSGFPAA